MFDKTKIYSGIFLSSLSVTSGITFLPLLAQNNNVDVRIKRQTNRINRAVQDGTLTPKQAAKLQANLNSISREEAAAKKQAGGKLSNNQITKLENDLNENFNNIRTQVGAGKKIKVPTNALGPEWAKGPDGAQDPEKLRRQMKVQEKRQLRQYGQAMQQVQEQQQQQYEKDMLKTLGQQRPDILQNKQDIEKIRQDTGAN